VIFFLDVLVTGHANDRATKAINRKRPFPNLHLQGMANWSATLKLFETMMVLQNP